MGEVLGALVCLPPFFLPLITGVWLVWSRGVGDPAFSRMAGWLTLKPLLATPLWILLLGTFRPTSMIGLFLTFIPAIIMTVIIVTVYSRVWFDPQWSRSATLLVILDTVRWGSTFLLLSPSLILYPNTALGAARASSDFGIFLSIEMPAIFAVAALVLVSRAAEREKRKRDEKPKRSELP